MARAVLRRGWPAVIVVAVVAGMVALARGSSAPAVRTVNTEGSVWLPSFGQGAVVLVSGSTGDVVSTVAVGPIGSSFLLRQDGSNAFVYRPDDGEFLKVIGSTLAATPPLSVGLRGAAFPGIAKGTAYLVGAREVRRVATDIIAASPALPLADDAMDVAVDAAGTVWLLSRAAGKLAQLEAGSTEPSPPRGDFGRDSLLVRAGPAVAVVDSTGPAIREPDGAVSLCAEELTGVAAPFLGDEGLDRSAPVAVVVAPAAGLIVRADFRARTCDAALLPAEVRGHRLGRPVTSAGVTFLGDLTSTTVWRVDWAAGATPTATALDVASGAPFDLIGQEGYVVYNDPTSDRAGVLFPVARSITKIAPGRAGQLASEGRSRPGGAGTSERGGPSPASASTTTLVPTPSATSEPPRGTSTTTLAPTAPTTVSTIAPTTAPRAPGTSSLTTAPLVPTAPPTVAPTTAPPTTTSAVPLLHAICAAVSEVPPPECDALGDLFDRTGGANWQRKDGWLATPTPCSWTGIACNAGHVTQIVLRGNNLTGSIPTTVVNLPELVVFNLETNLIGGPIPAELAQLSKLQEIYLIVNRLSGEIPPQLGQLTRLRTLALDLNLLTGPLPPELGNLTALREFRAGQNKLTGSIPASYGALLNVTWFTFEANGLSGQLPAAIAPMLTALQQNGGHLALRDQTGCLTAETPTLKAQLDLFDAAWANGCTGSASCVSVGNTVIQSGSTRPALVVRNDATANSEASLMTSRMQLVGLTVSRFDYTAPLPVDLTVLASQVRATNPDAVVIITSIAAEADSITTFLTQLGTPANRIYRCA